jgi:hypothetical protein
MSGVRREFRPQVQALPEVIVPLRTRPSRYHRQVPRVAHVGSNSPSADRPAAPA